ncbi:MAG: hypothetical protein JWR84_1140 [Caulobacter sp.]|nr:hypothetical protein [Caulobacter sp.]
MDRTIGTPRLWAILAGVAGLVSLAVTVAFRLLGPVKAAAGCLSDGAVIQFEFARKAQELTNIFGDPVDPCRGLSIDAVDAINQLDVAAYIPSYTLFAIFAALFVSGGKLRLPILLAILAAVVALAADYVETFTLLKITPTLEPQAALLPTSSTAAWVKFAALAAHALILAAVCLEKPPRRWILGILLLAPAVGVLAAFSDARNLNLLTLSFLLAWLPLLGLAIWRAVRPAPREL